MTLYTIDKNCLYRLDVEHCQWGDKLENAISFELNNLPDNKKDVVPNETVFIMSIEDAKQLHAWLGVVLNNA